MKHSGPHGALVLPPPGLQSIHPRTSPWGEPRDLEGWCGSHCFGFRSGPAPIRGSDGLGVGEVLEHALCPPNLGPPYFRARGSLPLPQPPFLGPAGAQQQGHRPEPPVDGHLGSSLFSEILPPHIPGHTGELPSSPGPGRLTVWVVLGWVPVGAGGVWGCLRRALLTSGKLGHTLAPPPWATRLELADCLSPLNKTLGNSCSRETSWGGVGVRGGSNTHLHPRPGAGGPGSPTRWAQAGGAGTPGGADRALGTGPCGLLCLPGHPRPRPPPAAGP